MVSPSRGRYQSKGDVQTSVHYLNRRLIFFEATYPQLNGAVAWALEDIGDLQVSRHDPGISQMGPPPNSGRIIHEIEWGYGILDSFALR